MSVQAPESPVNVEKRTGFIDLSEAQLDELMARIADGHAKADGQPDTARPSTGTDKKNKRKKKDRKPAIKPTIHHHGIEGLNKGDGCPSCQAGKVYKYHPAQLLRIVGHSPFSAEQHVSEQLRCSACHEIFTAEPVRG